MTHSTVRPATSADIAAIGAIAEATGLFPADMLDDMIRSYIDGTSDDIWFVNHDSQTVNSFGFCEPERMTEGTWNLLAIGVAPELQGSGIGAKMMGYIEKKLANSGARILLVETMGTPELQRTREFYVKNQYVQEALIREYYEPGADKIVFWKHLSSLP